MFKELIVCVCLLTTFIYAADDNNKEPNVVVLPETAPVPVDKFTDLDPAESAYPGHEYYHDHHDHHHDHHDHHHDHHDDHHDHHHDHHDHHHDHKKDHHYHH